MPLRLVIITTSHWTKEWFSSLILPFSRYNNGETAVEFCDISGGDWDASFKKVVAALESSTDEDPVAVFSCTDSTTDIYCAAVEYLTQERSAFVPKIAGTNFKCFFLATNKLACRKLVAGCGGLRSEHVLLSMKSVPSLGCDGFFKPLAECGSKGVFKISKDETATNPFFGGEAQRAFANKVHELAQIPEHSEILPFLNPDIVGLVEEYVPPSTKKVSIDGFVANKEIFHYMISDNVYKEDSPEVFDSLVTPSQSLTKLEIEVLWRLYDKVASDMIRRGLDNQFFDVEAFLMINETDGSPRAEVMEVNCRPFCNQIPIFSKLFGSCDLFSAAVDLLTGKTPPISHEFSTQMVKPVDSPKDSTGEPPKVGVCAYMPNVEGAPSVVESADATYFAVPPDLGFKAHVYVIGADWATARKRCDEFHAEVMARYSPEGGAAASEQEAPKKPRHAL